MGAIISLLKERKEREEEEEEEEEGGGGESSYHAIIIPEKRLEILGQNPSQASRKLAESMAKSILENQWRPLEGRLVGI